MTNILLGYLANPSSTSPRLSYVCRVPHHEHAKVDREFYSKDPILVVVFAHVYHTCAGSVCTPYEGWYGSIPTNLSARLVRHVCHTCADSASRVCEGLYGSIQREPISTVECCPCSLKRMGAVPIVNGNVWERFRGCWHERFVGVFSAGC